MNSDLPFIAVSFLAFADHSFTRFYLDKSSTIKPNDLHGARAINSERSNPRKNGWQWTILCGVSTRKAVSYCEFELNKNNSMNFILAYIAVSFSAFADHGFTRFYLDKSSTIKPKWPPWSPRDRLRANKSKQKWMTVDFIVSKKTIKK